MLKWLRNLFTRRASREAELMAALRTAVRARYDSAQTTDENTRLWAQTDLLSVRAANSFGVRRNLRTRSRYEVANNSYARGITRTMANDLIGTGPRIQLRTPDVDFNKLVADKFTAWQRAVCHAEKLRTRALAWIVDGEGPALLVSNPHIKDPVQLDIWPLESEMFTTPDLSYVGKPWVDGVELDSFGNPTAYHVLQQHPGDVYTEQRSPLKYNRVPADNVLFWIRKDRPGQVRGIPMLTPALELFAMLRRYMKAVLVSAELAADFSLFMKTDAPLDGTTTEPTPFETLNVERGMLTTLPVGSEVQQLASTQPNANLEMFVRIVLREIARCINVPLNVAMGDSSGYNYSSGRLDHLGYHRGLTVDRADLEQQDNDRTFAAWYTEATLLPGYLPGAERYPDPAHRWFWDGLPSIDPVKDATADSLLLEGHMKTLADHYAERGEDWEEQIDQIGIEQAKLKKLGLVPEVLVPPGKTQPMSAAMRAALCDIVMRGDQ